MNIEYLENIPSDNFTDKLVLSVFVFGVQNRDINLKETQERNPNINGTQDDIKSWVQWFEGKDE